MTETEVGRSEESAASDPAADRVEGPGVDGAPPWLTPVIRRSIWRAIWSVLLTLLAIWLLDQTRSLVSMLVISLFFSLALQPGVTWLNENRGWRRGAAVGAIYVGGFVFLAVLIVILIPAIVDFAERLREGFPTWIASISDFTQDNFGFAVSDQASATGTGNAASSAIKEWGDDIVGAVAGITTTGISLVFNLATIALFTFYFTADAPRIRRVVLSRLSPERQERLGWTWDEAIRQTGGYFYSRLLIMIINGLLFFFAMVLVGMPVGLSVPLSIFEAFVATFIPAVGTYIGSAVPILVTLGVQGFTAALILLIWVLIYQQVENYFLSPKISSKTMALNGGVSFGAALAGGAIAGPIGAFMSLPVAALITSLASNYSKSYEVVYSSQWDHVAERRVRRTSGRFRRRSKEEPAAGDDREPGDSI